jgi:hypothetical protein
MARQHTNGAPSNPDVRFERADVDVRDVVKGGVYLLVVLAASSAFTTWLAWKLTVSEDPVKNTDLPPSKAEQTARQKQPLPDPPLEALDDLRKRDRKNFHLYPPRAAEVYRKERQDLADEEKRGVGPIAAALKEHDKLFPVRKEKRFTGKDKEKKETQQTPPAPDNYGVELPSKSSSGRKTTGGQ